MSSEPSGRRSEPEGRVRAREVPAVESPGDVPHRVSDGMPSSETSAAASQEQEFFCDLCGAPMLNLHCKLSCGRCGYKRDCSDP